MQLVTVYEQHVDIKYFLIIQTSHLFSTKGLARICQCLQILALHIVTKMIRRFDLGQFSEARWLVYTLCHHVFLSNTLWNLLCRGRIKSNPTPSSFFKVGRPAGALD